MGPESNREYHLRRARAELDLAYRSDHRVAVEAHLRLSALHMRELGTVQRDTSAAACQPPAPVLAAV